MIEKRKIIVSKDFNSLRLDQFLKAELPSVSRGYIQKIIKKGNVLINGNPDKKGDILKEGDVVYIKEVLFPDEVELKPNPHLPIKIIYEDKDIIVIDKPYGIPSHPVDFGETDTVANFLIAKFPEIKNIGEKPLEPGMIHRLDINTSGLMLVAKNRKSFERLKYDQKEGKIKKVYSGLVIGNLEEGGKIETHIAHHPKDERKMKVFASEEDIKKYKARKAVTIFEVSKKYSGYTLLKVRIEKGLMHQIRVHLASIGHPIAGDKLYQTKKFRKLDATNLGRHSLHASGIEFPHPSSGKHIKFSSPLPQELEEVLRQLLSAVL